MLKRIDKTLMLIVHQKTKSIAGGAATKAVIELFFTAYRERGCFFLMKRTTGSVIFARAFKFNPTVNQVNDVSAIKYPVDEALGDTTGHVRRLTQSGLNLGGNAAHISSPSQQGAQYIHDASHVAC